MFRPTIYDQANLFNNEHNIHSSSGIRYLICSHVYGSSSSNNIARFSSGDLINEEL